MVILKSRWYLAIPILVLNITQLVIWHIDVYKYPLLSVFAEMAWIFLVASVVVNPVVSLIVWIKDKFSGRSKFMYLFIWTVMTLLYMLFFYVDVRDLILGRGNPELQLW